MGKKFGRKWNLSINSPREALSLIDANKPGLLAWIKNHLSKYSRYRVICEYEDGKTEALDNDSYPLERKLKSIRFAPVLEGAGNALRVVLGAVLIAVGTLPGFQPLMGVGISMVLGGVIGMLSPQPKSRSTEGGLESKYFDGPADTTQQGSPVQLIYGKRVLVGSQMISASMSIDQIL